MTSILSKILILFLCIAIIGWFLFHETKSPFYWGCALDGEPISLSQLERFEKDTLHKPQFVVFYLQWPSSKQSFYFPEESLNAIWQSGAVPCLTWEPMYSENNEEIPILFQEILNGKYDAYLTFFAKKVSTWDHPLVIRFAHEMNLERYHWGTSKEEYGASSPELYKKVFQYVVNQFRKLEVRNALWAFNPNAESIPNPQNGIENSWNTIAAYYPGDQYVDIFGIDGYNWGTSKAKEWNSTWRSFSDIFSSAYEQLKQLSSHKPIFIFETASVQGLEADGQEQWLKQAIHICKQWNVTALIWFQVNKEQDWRLLNKTLNLQDYFSEKPSSQEWVHARIDVRDSL